MRQKRVSEAVIRRLPKYYRNLLSLQAGGAERISSSELAARMRLNPSQVRQDFNCFGGFGQQGYGYNVKTLLEQIRKILTNDCKRSAIVIGAGHIGQALAFFEGFERDGVSVRALFDIDERLVGTSINGRPVLHVDMLETYIKDNDIDIGIIAARRSVAQTMTDRMAAAGIKGVWNFAPEDVVSEVPVESVNLSDSLLCLLFHMKDEE
ncbi:MAG: redox-sensing transcriptional repressor Rex [Eubacteriales bacterium]|nr:redox-sensing transcriptional repressor Rex [Eubacteriales bacterium]